MTTQANTEIATQQPTVMQILANAVMSKEVSIDVVERLVAMQRQMMKDDAERQFNEAMNRVQQKLSRINANMTNSHTSSKYADYAQIDRVIRPVYTAEGFSLSFSDGERIAPEVVRIVCYVSHVAGHTRMAHKDMPVVTMGPQGKAVMTPVHATGSADSYAKRYLVKDIFNLAVGEDDNDGNAEEASAETVNERTKRISEMFRAEGVEKLTALYRANIKDALAAKDYDGIPLFDQARDKRMGELNAA